MLPTYAQKYAPATPRRETAVEVLSDVLGTERRLLEELMLVMRKQRAAVSSDDLQSLDDSVFATYRVLATLGGTLLPSATLALTASRWGQRHAQARGLRAFTAGLTPLTIGLLLATGWILLQPVGLRLGAVVLVVSTLVLMLRTRRSPLWAVAAGGLAGVLGWV